MKKFYKALFCLLMLLVVLIACAEIQKGIEDIQGGAGEEKPQQIPYGKIEGQLGYAGPDDGFADVVLKICRTDGLQILEDMKEISVNEDGSYSAENLVPGAYSLYAAGNGKAAVLRNVVVTDNSTVTADVFMVETADIRGKITAGGTVTDVGGLTVFVAGTSFSAETDAEGNYSITGLPEGMTYQLVLMKDDFRTVVSDDVKVVSSAGTVVPDFYVVSLSPDSEGNLIWKGVLNTTPAKPEENTAYFDAEQGWSAIYKNSSWNYFAKKEEHSKTLIWLGNKTGTDPEYPFENCAYYRTDTGTSAVYRSGRWVQLCAGGKDGIREQCLNQKQPLSAKPVNPNVLDVYYDGSSNENQKKTYLFTGTEWVVIAEESQHVHVYDAGSVFRAPTCTGQGELEKFCYSCHERKTEIIPAKGHSIQSVQAREATCTAVGNLAHFKCSECNTLFSDSQGQNKIDNSATLVVPAKGHAWGDWKKISEPTCENKGAEQKSCTVCGEIENRSVNALGHAFGNWHQITAPSCTAKGKDQRECSRCDKTESKDIKATGHAIVSVKAKASTCLVAGNSAYYQCSTCNACFSDAAGKTSVALKDTILPLSTVHTWGEWTVTVEPTAEMEGTRERECTICHLKESGNILPLAYELAPVLPGKFSVSETGKVQFTRGNLFYEGASGGSWKLEAKQFDFRNWEGASSVSNGEVKTTSGGHVGLFYWALNKADAVLQKPNSSIWPAYTDTLFAKPANVTISDLERNDWFVLTTTEWNYLIGRKSADGGKLYGFATITTQGGANVTGLVLLPDTWVLPEGVDFVVAGSTGNSFASNKISQAQWRWLEDAGAVFLPAAGVRNVYERRDENDKVIESYDGSVVRGAFENSRYWASNVYEYHEQQGVGYLDITSGGVSVFTKGVWNWAYDACVRVVVPVK